MLSYLKIKKLLLALIIPWIYFCEDLKIIGLEKVENYFIQEYIEKYEYFNHINLYFQQGLY